MVYKGAIRIEDITIEDLQEQHKQYAQVIGVEKLIALSKEFGGSHIYIPQTAELLKLKKYKAIFEEFTGDDRKALSKKYEVSESTVYNILKEQLRENRKNRKLSKDVIDGQMSILDLLESNN